MVEAVSRYASGGTGEGKHAGGTQEGDARQVPAYEEGDRGDDAGEGDHSEEGDHARQVPARR